MKKILSILFALVLAVSLGLAMAAPVAAATLTVNKSLPNVPPNYHTIQAAIDAASSGDTITVAAGEYNAFRVQGKSNISIISTAGATITAANFIEGLPVVGDAWVMAAVYDSENINIEGINFDGTGVNATNVVVGIAYVDSSGTIADLTVENIVGTDLGAGVAIIGHESTSTAEMKRCTISNNDNIGIYVCGGSTLEAHFNIIVGNVDFGVVNDEGGTVDARYNWWGDASGPYPVGTGDTVSDGVNFTPWLNQGVTSTVSDDKVDAKAQAGTEVLVNGNATVTVFRYPANPGGDPPSNFGSLGKYIDVYVPDTSQVTQIEIRLYYTDDDLGSVDEKYEKNLRLRWWNGTEWAQCSDSGVNTATINGYSGYMWAKIRADTLPSLADLQGTGFDGGYEGPTQPPQGLCAIATAAYGTGTAKEIDILREFRDAVLLPNSLGAKFVSFYYKTSPPIANFISQHEVLRTAVRVGFVDPIVKILNWTHNLWSARGS